MPNETYDLMLIVSAEAEDSRKSALRSEVDALIAKGGGSISESTDWGNRPLAFDIDHESAGDYTIVRFEGPGTMIEPLSRQLNITDGLLRHRVIKAVPGAPATVGPSAAASGVPTPPSPVQAAAPATPAPAAPPSPPAADAEHSGEAAGSETPAPEGS